MLVSFVVQNYLSIRERQEISFLAATSSSASKEPLSHNYTTKILNNATGKAFPLLKSAIVYGANASGKTNILLALRNFTHFVEENYANDYKKIPLTPFLLDATSRNALSEFEVTLLLDGTLYRYGFSLDSHCIHEEWLFAADKGKERCLFTREKKQDSEGYDYHFGPSTKALLRSNAPKVRHNSLLLTHASLNNEPTARRIFAFLKNFTMRPNDMNTAPQPHVRPLLVEALKMIDIGLSDMEFKKISSDEIEARIAELLPLSDDTPEAIREHIRKDVLQHLQEEAVYFVYSDTKGNTFSLAKNVQSEGTCSFFSLLAYILTNISTPQVLLIDEVEKSLHPLLLRYFFQIFHALPHNNIQLLCSTHNTHILHEDVFRRDQVYIIEKGRDHDTTLKSLADYAGMRQGINLGKYYLEGRFGGIPLLSDGDIHRFVARLEQAQQEVAREHA